MTNFIQKTHLDIGFSDFNCLLDSQCSLLTSQILGRCIKLKWSNRAYESIATVGEIRVYRRADFQSGSRVLKKVF